MGSKAPYGRCNQRGQSFGSALIKSWLAPLAKQPAALMHTEAAAAVAAMRSALPAVSAAFLVALGAVPGAWLRFRLVNHLEPLLPRRHWGTFGVNVVACFALGLIVGLEQGCSEPSRRLLLLLGTGFLGSLSTFSTFMAELQQELVQRHWREALLLLTGSVLGGLASIKAGLVLGAGA